MWIWVCDGQTCFPTIKRNKLCKYFCNNIFFFNALVPLNPLLSFSGQVLQKVSRCRLPVVYRSCTLTWLQIAMRFIVYFFGTCADWRDSITPLHSATSPPLLCSTANLPIDTHLHSECALYPSDKAIIKPACSERGVTAYKCIVVGIGNSWGG